MPRKRIDAANGTGELGATTSLSSSTATSSTHHSSLSSDAAASFEVIGRDVGLAGITAPQRKIYVLLMGNHSSGKSTFINWYIGEHIQKTSVAMETSTFTFVTSGRRRETLRGAASAQYFPHVARELTGLPGVPEYLQTEVSVSCERRFPMVTFIDTPGLVDGTSTYPYPVEDVLVKLAALSDLIFIFLDPMGKAACKRTLTVAERLSKNPACAPKLRFYLTKADTVENMSDLLKVSSQVTRDLTPVVNAVNFELPTIFIPSPAALGGTSATNGNVDPVAAAFRAQIPNHIHQVTHEIESAIQQSVQRAIHAVDTDSVNLEAKLSALLQENTAALRQNSTRRTRLMISTLLAVLIALSAVVFLFSGMSQYLVGAVFGAPNHQVAAQQTWAEAGARGVAAAASFIDDSATSAGIKWQLAAASLITASLLFVVPRVLWRHKQIAPRTRVMQLEKYRASVVQVVHQKDELYERLFESIRGISTNKS